MRLFKLLMIALVAIVPASLVAKDAFFDNVPYKGAFGVTNWAQKWTGLSQYGIMAAPATATSDVTVTDADIPPGSTVFWTADNTYHLDGRVFVDEGATLYIEAGTVIKGMPGDSIDASVLIVSRGAKIFAEGTADRPIIFTAESDDVNNPIDVAYDTKGLWGGLILLGNAPINVAAGENNIEGIPTTESRGMYGGDDPMDCSGVLRYVSIRHGGISIGEGNEINGLTMGGVGAGTTIEYVEVFANLDDGFEWFGGTVNSKHLVAAFCGDDAFDHDEGLQCKMQFLFVIQHPEYGNMCGEHDGAPSSDVAAEPKAYPVIYNATFLGSGQNSTNPDQERIFRIRENWGGEYNNSIFGDYNGYGLDIESKYSPTDSKDRLAAGELHFMNNIWFNVNGFALADSIGRYDYVRDYLTNAANGNVEADPMLAAIDRGDNGLLDARPATTGPAWENLADYPNDGFFETVEYKGAFGLTNWADGWTALSQYGIMAGPKTPTGDVTVTDADIAPNSKVYWTADNTYHLDGRVFVDDGASLHIEAGTVVKGMPGDSIDASVLIVSPGGKIFAEGTANAPIIFTAESDDIANPIDVAYDTKGLWGGLILLGKAPINVAAGTNNIEGIPTTESRGIYGGTDPMHSSGVLRYVSIRHGGISIGEGNEINGLTMGGVGAGTWIDHVEVLSNLDDGFEWFGGTVNGKFLVAAYCGDDAFDHDEGLNNMMQYLFVLQHPEFGNMCAEHDGAPSSDVAAEPKAYPVTYNATFLGSGQTSANPDQERIFRIRENWGGEYNCSIFGDYNGYGLDIESKYSPTDSKDRLAAGELLFTENIWFNVNGYTMADSIGRYDYVRAYLNDAANMNVEVDPQLRSIDRTDAGLLDPRPELTSPAFKDIEAGVREYKHIAAAPAAFELEQNYPNPFNPVTTINYTVPKTGLVKVVVYNQLGQMVETLVDGIRTAGAYSLQWNASALSTGLYYYRLETADQVQTRKMMLIK